MTGLIIALCSSFSTRALAVDNGIPSHEAPNLIQTAVGLCLGLLRLSPKQPAVVPSDETIGMTVVDSPIVLADGLSPAEDITVLEPVSLPQKKNKKKKKKRNRFSFFTSTIVAQVPNTSGSQPNGTVQRPPVLLPPPRVAVRPTVTAVRVPIVDPKRPTGALSSYLADVLTSREDTSTTRRFTMIQVSEAEAASVVVKVFGEDRVALNPRFSPPPGHPSYGQMVDVIQTIDIGGKLERRRTGRRVPISYEVDVVVDDAQVQSCCNIEVTSERVLSEHKWEQLDRYTDRSGTWKFLNGGRQTILYAPNLLPDEEKAIHEAYGNDVIVCRTDYEEAPKKLERVLSLVRDHGVQSLKMDSLSVP